MSKNPEGETPFNSSDPQPKLSGFDKESLDRNALTHEAKQLLKVVVGTSMGDDERQEIANNYADAMDDEYFSAVSNKYLRVRIIRERKSGETVEQTMRRFKKEDKD